MANLPVPVAARIEDNRLRGIYYALDALADIVYGKVYQDYKDLQVRKQQDKLNYKLWEAREGRVRAGDSNAMKRRSGHYPLPHPVPPAIIERNRKRWSRTILSFSKGK